MSEDIDNELARRQIGYGRGKRMEIEKDEVEITSGVRFGKTIGSPIAMIIKNRDWVNWREIMSLTPISQSSKQAVTKPRPGHADLAGALKYHHKDIRNVLERASARETAARVAIGGVCRKLLQKFNIKIFSYVVEIGGIRIKTQGLSPQSIFKNAEASVLRCPSAKQERAIKKLIDDCKARGDSLGGVFEIRAEGVPPGVGSYSQWDRRLDGRLAQAIMSIQAIKGVEVGIGFKTAQLPGSQVHDEIYFKTSKGFYRKTNHAGGLEGGISNGEPIMLRAAMKPIATLYTPLKSVDIISKRPTKATVERSDICRVPSAAIIAEAMVCYVLAGSFLEKFGGDSMAEVSRNYRAYLKQLKRF
jgi:chorismate synthase